MIVVELTEREARALANTVDLARVALEALIDDEMRSRGTALAMAHGKLIAAIERQETKA